MTFFVSFTQITEEERRHIEDALKRAQSKMEQAQNLINKLQQSRKESKEEWDQIQQEHIDAMKQEVQSLLRSSFHLFFTIVPSIDCATHGTRQTAFR